MKEKYFNLRRKFLKWIVPEFVWPKTIFLDSVPIKVRNMNYSFGVKRILIDGSYELPERQLLNEINLKGLNVIEMGSSIGILTQILAAKIGSNSKIIGIEADRNLASQTKIDLKSIENLQILSGYAFPVLEINNSIKILGFDTSLGSLGGMVNFEQSSLDDEVKNESILDLQTIIDMTSIKPDLLVIDIEGAENIMLNCDPNFPESINFILIELHPGIYSLKTADEIILKIKSVGFYLKNSIANSYLFIKAQNL